MKSILLICACLFVVACNMTIPYKEGGTIDEWKNIDFQCKISADKNVPVRFQESISPIIEVPSKKTCTKQISEDGLTETTVCEEEGGYTTGGNVIREDVNVGLRNEYYKRCVSRSGYSYITLPTCKKSELPYYPPGMSTPLKSLSGQSCILNNDGSTGWVINP